VPGFSVSARLTVFFDGQFWIALYEREDEEGVAIARHIFGPEPSLPEVLELVAGPTWFALDFVPCEATSERRTPEGLNPKRAQREAAREIRSARTATRAQDAMRLGLEERALQANVVHREEREAQLALRREREVAKRKAKKRGR
jgi:hypothetical protein